jgi:hypothetical protein
MAAGLFMLGAIERQSDLETTDRQAVQHRPGRLAAAQLEHPLAAPAR